MTNIIQFTLNSDNTSQVIKMSDLKGQLREAVIGGVFDGANITLERKLSDNAGFQPYKVAGSLYTISSVQSGLGLAFLNLYGELKFVLNNIGETTNIPIDLST